MKFGYIRISTADQKIDLQVDALLKDGVLQENMFQDVSSGAKKERKGLDEMLAKLRRGDEVIVWKLDRIARSTIHIAKLMQEWEKQGVEFRSISEAFLDTTTSHGKFVFTLFSAIAQLEGDIIRERTNAGLAAARARGRVGGRKKGLTKASKAKARLAKSHYVEGILSVREICEEVGISSRATFYKYLRFMKIEPTIYKPRKQKQLTKIE